MGNLVEVGDMHILLDLICDRENAEGLSRPEAVAQQHSGFAWQRQLRSHVDRGPTDAPADPSNQSLIAARLFPPCWRHGHRSM